MAITLSPETRQRLIASLKRYAAENLDEELGDLKAGLLLDYCLTEIGPVDLQPGDRRRAGLFHRSRRRPRRCLPRAGVWLLAPIVGRCRRGSMASPGRGHRLRRGGRRRAARRPGPPHRTDLAYDGQFTFVRLRWKSDLGFSRRGGFSSAWNHDYPRAEQHLSQILQRADRPRHPHRRQPDPHARRSRSVQVPARVHVGARLLESDRSRSGGVPRLPGEGRLRRVRGLRRRSAVEQLRGADAPGAAERAVRPARQRPSHLRHVLRDQGHPRHRPPDVRHPSQLLRDLTRTTIRRSG